MNRTACARALPGLGTVLCALSLIFSACSKNPARAESPNKTESTITFTDDAGRTVSVAGGRAGAGVDAANPRKVAALQLSLAHVWQCAGGTVSGASADALDEFPGAENLGTMMNPNAELLISGGYDFVVMSARVGAHKKLEPLLAAAGIPCAYFSVESFADYLRVLKICTDITGDAAAFQKNGEAVARTVEGQRTAAGRARLAAGGKSPRVLVLRASSGKVAARSAQSEMTAEMLAELGCTNIADSDSSILENLSLEKIVQENPDFIFVTTMGARSQGAQDALAAQFTGSPVWNSLSAVQNGRFVMLPDDLFHYKPCERWAESYEYLNKILW